MDDIIEWIKFKLPAAAVGFAIAAFGLTGVGGDEIVAYNFWCIEKGYARFTGPLENSKEWRQRAKGWIKVMNLDALWVSCIAIFCLGFYGAISLI